MQDPVLRTAWKVSCWVRSAEKARAGLEALFAQGIAPESLVESRTKHRIEMAFYFPTDAQRRKFLKIAGKVKGLKFTSAFIKPKDWQDRWKKGIRPFPLTSAFTVVPAWAGKKFRIGSKCPVYIDTNLAFGTGLHETTRFMAGFVEEQEGFQSFLDVGTGTGILAILASLVGGGQIDAIDIDPQSVRAARENLRGNRVKNVRVFCADLDKWRCRKKYDFVAANLVTYDLVRFGKKLVQLVKPGKFLAVSGISLKNLSVLRRGFKDLPLRPVKTVRGKEWAALLYQKYG